MENVISHTEKFHALGDITRNLEMEISEGLSGVTEDRIARNIFGRRPLIRPDAGLAYAVGLAISGIRSTAFLSGKQLVQELQILVQAAERKVPMVVYLSEADFATLFPILNQSGVFVLAAYSAQEAIDLGLIARAVAEAALLPGVVVLAGTHSANAPVLLSKEKMISFLGNPDDSITPPTPAQQIIFGKTRKRIPRWINPDVPVLEGIQKSGKAREDADAAGVRFFQTHLPTLIEQAFESFKVLSGRAYSSAAIVGDAKPAKFLLPDWERAASVSSELEGKKDKSQTACISLRLWAPFPAADLLSLVGKGKPLTVLEGDGASSGALFRMVHECLDTAAPSLFEAKGTAYPGASQLDALIQNMSKNGAPQKNIRLGTAFTAVHSTSPQHEVMLQSVARAYPGIDGEVIEESIVSKASVPSVTHLSPSWIARHYKDQGPIYSRLPQFYQHILHFYNTGQASEIKADPFQALPLVPAASAALADFGATRTHIPQLDPIACTACGACLSACPHTALPSAALRLEQIIKGGMDMATKQGTPLSSLTPLVKNLAVLCGAALSGNTHASLIEVLEDAMESLAVQMRLEGDKLEKVRRDIATLGDLLQGIPFVFSDSLFYQSEQSNPSNGVALLIAVDSSACTGCGICAAVCPSEALRMVPISVEEVKKEAHRVQVWEQLPDTEPAVVEEIRTSGKMIPIAVPMLSRQAYRAVVGGADENVQLEHKRALHQISTWLKSERLVVGQQQQKVIREVIDQLSGRIHQLLSDALPKREFSQIEQALEAAGGEKVPLDSLLAKVGAEAHLNKVDTQLLQRQTQLVHELKDLDWLLKEGPTGAGSAFASMVLSLNKADWANQFPINPFTIPVLVADKKVDFEEVIGMLQGQLRHWLDTIRLIRRGKLEASGKYQPHIQHAALSALEWDSLEPEERTWFPPLVLAVDAVQFDGSLWSQLQELPFMSWPVKVLVLDKVAYTNPAALRRRITHLSGISMAGKIPVYRCMEGESEQMKKGIAAWASSDSPAVLHWFSPAVDGAGVLEAALMALRTRAFPVATMLGGRVVLQGNPAPELDWVDAAIPMPDGTFTYSHTYADWLVTQPAWEQQFRPWRPEEGKAMALSSYLRASEPGRKGSVPVVAKETSSPEGFTYWIANSLVLAMVNTAAAEWEALQGMAGGQYAGEPRQIEALEKSLKEAHSAEIASLRKEFDNQLAQEQIKWLGKVKDQLRDKLLALSTMKK